MFRRSEVAALLTVGVVGVLVPGLQPQLLGALLQAGVLTPASLGTVATAELLAMGLAAGGAGWVLPLDRVRPIAVAALLAAAALDVATMRADATTVLPLRAAAGLAEGVLVWLAIGFIVRSARPARWSAVYLMTQTLAQLAVASVLGAGVIARLGFAGGFAALGLASVAAVAAVPWLPRRFDALASDAATARPSARGWVALAGVAAWLGFVVAVWVFVEPLGAARGLAPATLALVAPVSLAMQVVGAGAAAMIADRARPLPVVMVVALAELAVLATMARAPSATMFVVAAGLFGFLWLFVMPFQLPIVIAADRGPRAAALIGGAQLVGASLGPVLAGLLIGERAVGGVLVVGAAMLLAATLLLAAAGRPRREDPPLR